MAEHVPKSRCQWYVSPLQEECGQIAIGTFEFEGLDHSLKGIPLCRFHHTHTKNRFRAIARRRAQMEGGDPE